MPTRKPFVKGEAISIKAEWLEPGEEDLVFFVERDQNPASGFVDIVAYRDGKLMTGVQQVGEKTIARRRGLKRAEFERKQKSKIRKIADKVIRFMTKHPHATFSVRFTHNELRSVMIEPAATRKAVLEMLINDNLIARHGQQARGNEDGYGNRLYQTTAAFKSALDRKRLREKAAAVKARRNPAPASERKAAALLEQHGAKEIHKKIEAIGNKIRARQRKLGMDKPGPLAMLQEGLAHATDAERERLHLLKLAAGMADKADRAGAHERILARRAAKKAAKAEKNPTDTFKVIHGDHGDNLVAKLKAQGVMHAPNAKEAAMRYASQPNRIRGADKTLKAGGTIDIHVWNTKYKWPNGMPYKIETFTLGEDVKKNPINRHEHGGLITPRMEQEAMAKAKASGFKKGDRVINKASGTLGIIKYGPGYMGEFEVTADNGKKMILDHWEMKHYSIPKGYHKLNNRIAVRFINKGDKLEEHEKAVNKGEPMVAFYDIRSPKSPKMGKRVARFLASMMFNPAVTSGMSLDEFGDLTLGSADVRNIRSHLNKKTKKNPAGKTLSKVKTKHSTPPGLFEKTADQIVSGLLKDAHGDSGLAMKRLTFYINRAGKNLSNKRSVMAAKKRLSEIKRNPAPRKRMTQTQRATAYMDKVLKHLIKHPYAQVTIKLEGIVPDGVESVVKAQAIRILKDHNVLELSGEKRKGLNLHKTTSIFRKSLKKRR